MRKTTGYSRIRKKFAILLSVMLVLTPFLPTSVGVGERRAEAAFLQGDPTEIYTPSNDLWAHYIVMNDNGDSVILAETQPLGAQCDVCGDPGCQECGEGEDKG